MSYEEPESPWNPGVPVVLTPREYERQVVAWLRASAESLEDFSVRHLQHLSGSSGDFEFDAVAEFPVFGGARLVVLVECKRLSRPVERDEILALWAKLQDVGAHKAMVFATCGFQSGAVEYAQSRGIATITFVGGVFQYETRMLIHAMSPSSWTGSRSFAGIWLSTDGSTIHCTSVDHDHVQSIRASCVTIWRLTTYLASSPKRCCAGFWLQSYLTAG